MLRINLLPPYIYAGKAKGRVTTVWLLILVALVGGLFFFKKTIDDKTNEIKEDTEKNRPIADKADADQAKANGINAESATVRAKADFVRNAVKFDQDEYPHRYRNVVEYTWNRVLYDYIRPDGGTVSMSAYTPTLTDVAHYILAMERNPDVSRVDIRMGSIPGFPNSGQAQQGGQQQAPGVRPEGGSGHDFLVTLNLYNPIPPGPAYPPGGGGGSQPSGGMGGGGGMSGGMMGGGGMSGGMMGGGGMSGGMGGGGMSGGMSMGGKASGGG